MENGKEADSYSQTLKKFKRNVKDILTPIDTDPYLLKWLKAKNYDVKKAEATFREMHAFREFYSLDTFCETYTKPEIVEKFEYTAFLGYAKDGSIIRYNPLGKGDHYGFIASMSAYQLGFYGVHIMEEDLRRQRKRAKITGKNVTEITYIFDLAGLALHDILHKCVYEMGLDLGLLVQEYYPEIWGNIFFINVPPYFDTMFNMFKPVMRMSVIQSIQVLSRESTGEVLLKYIDEDVLPVFLGGKRVDSTGNPKCSEFLRFGGRVPEKYYLCNQSSHQLQPNDVDVKDVWVRARRIYNHSVVVRKPNTTIRVQLRTENGSIHMSIYYRKFNAMDNSEVVDIPSESEPLDEKDPKCRVTKVSPSMRVQSHMSPINDFNVAPRPGIYIYRFNNSHSWFTSRRLIFRIQVIEKDSS